MDILQSGNDRVGILTSWVFGLRIYSSGLLRVLGLSPGWESSISARWCSRFWVEFGWISTLQVELALLATTNYKIYVYLH